MYVDKPMRGHGLMQPSPASTACSRTSRRFVVDYLGLADELKQHWRPTPRQAQGKAVLDQPKRSP